MNRDKKKLGQDLLSPEKERNSRKKETEENAKKRKEQQDRLHIFFLKHYMSRNAQYF